jgi:hypothetical protein
MRAIDVKSGLSTLGWLPSFPNVARKCTRFAITWLQRAPLRLQLAILLTCIVSLLTVYGCHYLRVAEPFSILALSEVGADGAFGAGALVGLTNIEVEGPIRRWGGRYRHLPWAMT